VNGYEMRVEIHVYADPFDTALIQELFDKKDRKLLKSKDVILEELHKDWGRMYVGEVVAEFALVFSTTVAAQVAADWLYDKIKDRAHKLEIRKIRVKIEREEINRILVEIMDEKKD
jgi:hypothetical protein